MNPDYSLGIVCPQCGRYGTFKVTLNKDTIIDNTYQVGMRFCPHSSCGCFVYFIFKIPTNSIELVIPSLRIDFNTKNIPEKIIASLSEAITCHSNNCFIASAIMIRKTLEVLCEENCANGKNLYDRIQDMSSKVILPPALLIGLDDLRLLGNDAAHIEAKIFDDIGKEEVEVGIEFTKEILKALYQYTDLLDKLNKYKKTKT